MAQRYAVLAETAQNPNINYELLAPTTEADSKQHAARLALDSTEVDPDDIIEGEVLVIKVSDEPGTRFDVSDLLAEA